MNNINHSTNYDLSYKHVVIPENFDAGRHGFNAVEVDYTEGHDGTIDRWLVSLLLIEDIDYSDIDQSEAQIENTLIERMDYQYHRGYYDRIRNPIIVAKKHAFNDYDISVTMFHEPDRELEIGQTILEFVQEFVTENLS